eukprot:5897539-Amphidinium_carterae.1
MLQTPHPHLFVLGWGRFKSNWLKAPGPPAEYLPQQGTAGQALLRPPALHRLATAGKKHQCHACSLLSTKLVTPSHAVF